MFFQNSVGIDIGDEEVSLVWLRGGLRGRQLMDRSRLTVPDYKAEGGRDRHSEIAMCINSYLAEKEIVAPELALCLPEDRFLLRTLCFPLSIKENFRKTITYELEKFLPFSAEQIYYDCHIIREDKKSKELLIVLAAIKKEDLDPWLRMSRLLDGSVTSIMMSSAALANALASLPDFASLPAGACLYHLPNKGRLLCLLSQGRLLSSRILPDLPGQSLDIITTPERKLCDEFHLTDSGKLTLVQAEKTVSDSKDDTFASQTFPRPETFSLDSISFFPAYGLALGGLRSLPNEINLIPENQRQKTGRKWNMMLIVLLCVNLFLLATWSGSSLVRQSLLRTDLRQRVETLKESIRLLPEMKKEAEEAQQRIAMLNDFQSGRPDMIEILRELSTIIPSSAWTDSLQLDKESLQIEGLAESASLLLPLLEQSPLFHNVTFLSTIAKTKEGKEKFKIQMEVERP